MRTFSPTKKFLSTSPTTSRPALRCSYLAFGADGWILWAVRGGGGTGGAQMTRWRHSPTCIIAHPTKCAPCLRNSSGVWNADDWRVRTPIPNTLALNAPLAIFHVPPPPNWAITLWRPPTPYTERACVQESIISPHGKPAYSVAIYIAILFTPSSIFPKIGGARASNIIYYRKRAESAQNSQRLGEIAAWRPQNKWIHGRNPPDCYSIRRISAVY